MLRMETRFFRPTFRFQQSCVAIRISCGSTTACSPIDPELWFRHSRKSSQWDALVLPLLKTAVYISNVSCDVSRSTRNFRIAASLTRFCGPTMSPFKRPNIIKATANQVLSGQ